MQPPPIPPNESARLTALHSLSLLDTPEEPAFDQLVELVASTFDVPMASITLVDGNRQWFKASRGLPVCETERDVAFCGWVVANAAPFMVSDASLDDRFADNPLVIGEPFIRFYAGMPIHAPGGEIIGSLCLLDHRPRQLDQHELEQLRLFAAQVDHLIRFHESRGLLHENRQEHERVVSRYRALFREAGVGIVRIDSHGIIRGINPFACHMLGYQQDELIGQNVQLMMPGRWAREHDRYIARYLETGEAHIIGRGRQMFARHREGQEVPVQLAVAEVESTIGEPPEFVGILMDMSEITQANHSLYSQRRLLRVLHEGLTDYRQLMSGQAFWHVLKESLRDLTDSDYALIGEVADGSLDVHAITSLPGSDDPKALLRELDANNTRDEMSETLLGRVFARGETVIRTDFSADAHLTDITDGTALLTNVVAVPIVHDGEILGMYAIANSRSQIDQSLVEWLQPFTATCALMIRLYRDMAERQRMLTELREARDEQARASRAKTEFLSSMSHELRTPMNSVLGFAQLLLDGKREPLGDRAHRQVEQIHKSGKYLLDLINEVLDLAQIESGRLTLSIEPIVLGEVLQASLDTMENVASTAGISLRFDPPPSDCSLRVQADFTRLSQILINLISNAIKYNHSLGTVTVRCRTVDKTRVEISVSDTGPGIPAERQDELFQPFNRLGAENSAIEGSGVGLVITQRLVEAMQGTITVDSLPGKGSTFYVYLPLSAGERPIPSGTPRGGKTEALDTTNSEVRHAHRVLYIEDNPANQRLMEDVFDDLPDFELTVSHTGRLGLQIAEATRPDLILLDINLPDMTGFEALAVLTETASTRGTPVIAISANAMPSDQNAGMNAGFTDYLTKPLDIERLITAMDHALTEEIQ